jgi:dihydrofolate reductase
VGSSPKGGFYTLERATATHASHARRRSSAPEAARPARDSLLQGSGGLLRWLLERDLVDAFTLMLYPVVVGDGLRLFPERGQTHALTLVRSRSTPSGVTIQTYRPAARATFGTVGE